MALLPERFRGVTVNHSTWVRIPYNAPSYITGVAQLDRAVVSEATDLEFNSPHRFQSLSFRISGTRETV